MTAELTASTESIGNRILDEAETRAGDWYVYGGAGPYVFDCSGLVYWASHRLGVNMPRTTYGMLSTGVSSGLLYRVSSPKRGDLAFYGTGHVEIVTAWPHTTFRPCTSVSARTTALTLLPYPTALNLPYPSITAR